jgi:1-acyl-sn-glycerol-3-phosphate acyltransferase
MVELYPRQQEAKNSVFEHLDKGINTQLVAFPTGTRKNDSCLRYIEVI